MFQLKKIESYLALLSFCAVLMPSCGLSPEKTATTSAAETASVQIKSLATNTPAKNPTLAPTEEPFILALNKKPPVLISGLSSGSFIYGYAVLDLNNDGLNDLVYG
ncbi:MAG: hypothetical protein WBB64_02435, partial [Anaerolineales bacterium]